MMRPSWFIAVIVMAFMSAADTTPIHAAKLRYPINVPQWNGGGYLSDQSNTFERCSVTKVGNSASLSYSVDRDYRWSVRFSNPGWSFVKGARQGVLLKIGDTSPIRATAFSVDKDALEIQAEDPILLFSRLRVANKLRGSIGGLSIEFSLEGGEEALSALTQCAMRLSRRLSNGKSKYALFDARNSSPAHSEEARRIVADIISYSRTPNMKALPAAGELAALPADVTWKAGLAEVGLYVLEAAVPISSVEDEIVLRTLRSCKGGYFYLSREEKLNDMPLRRVLSSCETADGTTLSYYLIVRRPKSGYYVFTVTGAGSTFIATPFNAVDEYETGLRSVLALVLHDRPGASDVK